MIINNDKSCKNCKNFVQHYIKRFDSFFAIPFGHCRKNLSRKSIKDICILWEDNETKETERSQSLNSVLHILSNRLNKIAEVLEHEED